MAQTNSSNPVFATQTRVKQGFISKILGRKPAMNAIVDLTNLLASRPILHITEQEVQSISQYYKVDLYKKFAPKLKQLYAAFLVHCLSDNKLSNEEILQLKKLKSLLSLRDNDIGNIHYQVSGKIYQKSFAEALKDGRIEQHEKDFLERLEKELRLPEKLAQKISMDLRQSYVADFVKKIQEDYRVSPEELQELADISKSLNVELTIDAKTKATLDRMKWYWVIENGELTSIDVTVDLPNGEYCYYKTNAKLNDFKTGTKNAGDAAASNEIKITKGFSYKVGSSYVERLKPEELKLVDTGTLYVTNKRLIFVGMKNTSIKLDKISSVSPYADGIGVEKDTGGTPVFTVTYNGDVLAMMVSRVINDL